MPNVISDKKYGYISNSLEVEDFYNSLTKAFLEEESFDKKMLIEYFHKNFSMRKCTDSYLEHFYK